MSFNWWKRNEVKPEPRSRFPIKVKIEQAPEEAHGAGKSSGDSGAADAENPPKKASDRFCNQSEENG